MEPSENTSFCVAGLPSKHPTDAIESFTAQQHHQELLQFVQACLTHAAFRDKDILSSCFLQRQTKSTVTLCPLCKHECVGSVSLCVSRVSCNLDMHTFHVWRVHDILPEPRILNLLSSMKELLVNAPLQRTQRFGFFGELTAMQRRRQVSPDNKDSVYYQHYRVWEELCYPLAEADVEERVSTHDLFLMRTVEACIVYELQAIAKKAWSLKYPSSSPGFHSGMSICCGLSEDKTRRDVNLTAYCGTSQCRFCSAMNGDSEFSWLEVPVHEEEKEESDDRPEETETKESDYVEEASRPPKISTKWIWPTGFQHYLAYHAVPMPSEFRDMLYRLLKRYQTMWGKRACMTILPHLQFQRLCLDVKAFHTPNRVEHEEGRQFLQLPQLHIAPGEDAYLPYFMTMPRDPAWLGDFAVLSALLRSRFNGINPHACKQEAFVLPSGTLRVEYLPLEALAECRQCCIRVPHGIVKCQLQMTQEQEEEQWSFPLDLYHAVDQHDCFVSDAFRTFISRAAIVAKEVKERDTT